MLHLIKTYLFKMGAGHTESLGRAGHISLRVEAGHAIRLSCDLGW